MSSHEPLDLDLGELASRRREIMVRIYERVEVSDLGFVLDDKPSPCHIWTGPDSGTGKGGGYGRMSLNSQTVAVHLVVYCHYYGYIPGKSRSTTSATTACAVTPCTWRWSAISPISDGEQSEPRRIHERTFFVLPEHHL